MEVIIYTFAASTLTQLPQGPVQSLKTLRVLPSREKCKTEYEGMPVNRSRRLTASTPSLPHYGYCPAGTSSKGDRPIPCDRCGSQNSIDEERQSGAYFFGKLWLDSRSLAAACFRFGLQLRSGISDAKRIPTASKFRKKLILPNSPAGLPSRVCKRRGLCSEPRHTSQDTARAGSTIPSGPACPA